MNQVDERTGVIVNDDADRASLELLVKSHGEIALKRYVGAIRGNGGRPFPSEIYKYLSSPEGKRVARSFLGEFDPSKECGPAVTRI